MLLGRYIHKFKCNLTEVVTPVILALEAEVHGRVLERLYQLREEATFFGNTQVR